MQFAEGRLPPLEAIAVKKSALNAWATARKPDLGVAGVEVQSVAAGVTDLRLLVLAVAAEQRDRKVPTADLVGPGLDVFEPVSSVINQWVTASGTALDWPGVTVELVTDVSVSRRG